MRCSDGETKVDEERQRQKKKKNGKRSAVDSKKNGMEKQINAKVDREMQMMAEDWLDDGGGWGK